MTEGDKITVLVTVGGFNNVCVLAISALVTADPSPADPARFVWIPNDRYTQIPGFAWHEDEGILWARGWGDAVEKALLAAHALVTP